MKHLDPLHGQVRLGFSLLFLVGLSPSPLTSARVSEEASLYGDVVQAKFADHYNNLTIKAVYTLKYLVTNEWLVSEER